MDEVNRTGTALASLLMSRLEGTGVDDVYIDEDEEGPYLGLVFSDGEKAYHLTFDGNGTVEFSEGPLEGDIATELEEVVSFQMDEVQPPFSLDSSSAG